MRPQEERSVSLRRFRLGMVVAACVSSLLVAIPLHFRPDHVKRIAELESRQLNLYEALASKDQRFQNERRNYVERIKKRDQLLREQQQTIMQLRARLGADAERAVQSSAAPQPPATGEPVGYAPRTSAPELQGSISRR